MQQMCTCTGGLGLLEKWGSAVRAVSLSVLPNPQESENSVHCSCAHELHGIAKESKASEVRSTHHRGNLCMYSRTSMLCVPCSKFYYKWVKWCLWIPENTRKKFRRLNWNDGRMMPIFAELPFMWTQRLHWRQTASPTSIAGKVGKKEEIYCGERERMVNRDIRECHRLAEFLAKHMVPVAFVSYSRTKVQNPVVFNN